VMPVEEEILGLAGFYSD